MSLRTVPVAHTKASRLEHVLLVGMKSLHLNPKPVSTKKTSEMYSRDEHKDAVDVILQDPASRAQLNGVAKDNVVTLINLDKDWWVSYYAKILATNELEFQLRGDDHFNWDVKKQTKYTDDSGKEHFLPQDMRSFTLISKVAGLLSRKGRGKEKIANMQRTLAEMEFDVFVTIIIGLSGSGGKLPSPFGVRPPVQKREHEGDEDEESNKAARQ